MKKLTLAALATALTVAAAPALAKPILLVGDPSGGQFSGSYVIANDDPATTENEARTGQQNGYVGVYDNGVVVCNGNGNIKRPDDGSPLQGYIWVGGNAASNPTAASPTGPGGNSIGAGNNNENPDGTPTGKSPCPDNPPPTP